MTNQTMFHILITLGIISMLFGAISMWKRQNEFLGYAFSGILGALVGCAFLLYF